MAVAGGVPPDVLKNGKCWGTRKVDDGTPDPYFPSEPLSYRQATRADILMEQRAARLCEGCPVIKECLDYGLSRTDIYGVWGGKLRRERMLIRRSMQRAARAAEEEQRSA